MESITTKVRFDAMPVRYGIPQVVWAAWFGDRMNENRLRGMAYMQKHIGVPICLITKENLEEFIVPGYPLHRAFEYLSPVHRSDYLRVYLAHHYGGAWHDVKPTETSYADSFAEFADPDIYWMGKPEEKGRTACVFDADGNWMPDCWEKLVATPFFIARPHTPMSQDLIDGMDALLDRNLKKLRRNPGRVPYARHVKNFWFKWLLRQSVSRQGNNYPLNFTFFGDIMHPLNYKYYDHVSRNLPYDQNYCLNFPYR